eukprot:TRINITY_DN17279_c0_g1_i1.p1 TRINITY_DN17279_c0_g1~~TRINITY_DN17279_c0_g1_i1.p1  ORF type:complete len:511 (+),score=24.59 TRINITY_DN17279_c0_g1_i1:94-1626(+)
MGCCCARGRGAAADDGLPFLSGDGGINIYHSEADAASLTSLTPRVQRVRAIEDYGDRITVTVDVASQQPPRLSTPASAVSPLAGETEHVRLSIAIDDLPAFPRDGSFVSCVSMDTVETSPLGSPSAAPACTASPLHQGSEEAASGLLYSAAEISDQLATPGMTPGLSPALGLGETASAGPRSQLAGPPSGLQGSGRVAALPRPRGASTKLTCPPPQWLVSGHESVTVTDHRGHKRQVGLHFTGHSIEVSVDGFRILATRHFRKLADTALGREHRPHAEWKSCYEDKQGTRAWTRPAPSTPWLATADGVPYNDAVNQVRVCGEFHCPASLLYDVLHDSEYRSQWDANMIEGRRITEQPPFESRLLQSAILGGVPRRILRHPLTQRAARGLPREAGHHARLQLRGRLLRVPPRGRGLPPLVRVSQRHALLCAAVGRQHEARQALSGYDRQPAQGGQRVPPLAADALGAGSRQGPVPSCPLAHSPTGLVGRLRPPHRDHHVQRGDGPRRARRC